MLDLVYSILGLVLVSLVVSLWNSRISFLILTASSVIFMLYGILTFPLGLFRFTAGLVWFLVSIYSMVHYKDKWLNFALIGTILGIFVVLVSNTYLEFLAGWETMTVFSYVGIGLYRKEWRPNFTFMAFGELSTVFIIAGFVSAYSITGNMNFGELYTTLPLILTSVGFMIKMGIFPFLVVEWLPIAHGNARSDLSAVLSVTMTMAGIYGIFRMLLISPHSTPLGVLFLLVGAFSNLFGSLYSYVSDHVKGLLAFSTIENNGSMLTLLGILNLIHDRSLISFASFSLFTLVIAHALSKTGLFLSTGYVSGESMSNLKSSRSKLATLGVVLMTASMSGLLPTVGGIATWSLLETLFMSSITLPHLLNVVPVASGIMIGMGEGFATGAMARFASFTLLTRMMRDNHGLILSVAGALTLGLLTIVYLLSPFNSSVSTLGVIFDSLILSRYGENGFGGVSPLYVIIVLSCISPLVFLLTGRKKTRIVDQWDNGSDTGLTYTSFGMANNLRLMLKSLLRTRSGTLETSADIFWEAIVAISRAYLKFSRVFSRTYMNGSLSWYMIYMFLAFIAVMLVIFL